MPLMAAEDESEPRVARVSFVEGEASYLNADADEWTAVEVNAPLVSGDRFYSGPDARAEIQLPGGIYARLASETEIDLLEVSARAVHLRVGIGTATFRLRNVPAGQHVEISTPATALVARARGVYRVDVAEDGQTTVLVQEGEADAYLGEQRYRLGKGRGARIVDAAYVEDAPPLEVFDASRIANDPWDDWERSRAQRVQSSASYQYVDADVYGVEDLDEYGSWDRHQTYGPIWRPTRVEAGWAPFTRGRWVWQDPWGWTWVDYAPWGWAPSHYGRWVYVQDAWAWAPGPVVARPVYAPATVGFLGISVNSPSVSLSIGIGPSVGWVPLGYGEPIIPWWRGVGGVSPGRPWWGGWGGPRIVNNTVIKETNITNINVTNINYANFDRPRAFTAVSHESFVRGDLQRLDVPHERLREFSRPLRGAPEVIPQRESLFATRPEKLRQGRGLKPSAEVLQRAALSTRALPASRPDFAQKLQRIEQEKGAPVPPAEMRRLGRGKQDTAPQLRTVTARGNRAVVPEITAEAPTRLDGTLQRRAAGGQREQRSAGLEPERGRAVQPSAADTGARTLPGERAERPKARDQQGAQGGPDARTALEQRPGETQRRAAGPAKTAPGEREGKEGSRRELRQALDAPERSGRDGDGTTPRAAVGEQPPRAGERGATSALPQRREQAAEPRSAEPEATRERGNRGGRENEAALPGARAAKPQRDQQRQQVERPQRDSALQQQRSAEQAPRAQAERQQRQQAERAETDSQQRKQAERAQAERQQQRQAERVQAERQQRQQAERAQTERVQTERQQRQQAERVQAERQQRQQAERAQTERQKAERAQTERQQRKQAERVQAGRQQQQQAERVQAERQQRQQAERAQVERRQRKQTERVQRDTAERQQRAATQRAQDASQQRAQAARQAPQRKAAAERPSSEAQAEQREAKRKQRQDQQQRERARRLPSGG